MDGLERSGVLAISNTSFSLCSIFLLFEIYSRSHYCRVTYSPFKQGTPLLEYSILGDTSFCSSILPPPHSTQGHEAKI